MRQHAGEDCLREAESAVEVVNPFRACAAHEIFAARSVLAWVTDYWVYAASEILGHRERTETPA